jgi:hypothetical protein
MRFAMSEENRMTRWLSSLSRLLRYFLVEAIFVLLFLASPAEALSALQWTIGSALPAAGSPLATYRFVFPAFAFLFFLLAWILKFTSFSRENYFEFIQPGKRRIFARALVIATMAGLYLKSRMGAGSAAELGNPERADLMFELLYLWVLAMVICEAIFLVRRRLHNSRGLELLTVESSS